MPPMRILEHSGSLKPVLFEFMQNLSGVGFFSSNLSGAYFSQTVCESIK